MSTVTRVSELRLRACGNRKNGSRKMGDGAPISFLSGHTSAECLEESDGTISEVLLYVLALAAADEAPLHESEL